MITGEIRNISDALYKTNMFVSYKQDTFNYNMLIKNIKNICQSLEKLTNVKLKDIEIKTKNKIKPTIEENHLYRITCKFEDLEEEGKEYKFSFLIPKLISGNYFVINGVRFNSVMELNNYRPVYKYKKNGLNEKITVILKTFINRFQIELKLSTRKSISNVILFRKKVPLVLVLSAIYKNGKNLLDKLFGENQWEYIEKDDNRKEDDYYIINDKSNNHALYIKKNLIKEWHLVILNTLHNMRRVNLHDFLYDDQYILKMLGKLYTTNTNTYESKGRVIVSSINRSLDNNTKNYLKVDHMGDLFLEIIKEGIERRHDNIEFKSNFITEKRLSFIEIILFPLYKKLSDSLYTYLNNARSSKDNIFKVQERIILDNIHSVIQYDDSTNCLDILKKIKVSLAPTGISKEATPELLRKLNPSYIGFLDLFSSPNGKSAGLSTFVNPMSRVYIADNSVIKLNDLDIKEVM
jgi:DNA-directed RNA polymerase beta subunit